MCVSHGECGGRRSSAVDGPHLLLCWRQGPCCSPVCPVLPAAWPVGICWVIPLPHRSVWIIGACTIYCMWLCMSCAGSSSGLDACLCVITYPRSHSAAPAQPSSSFPCHLRQWSGTLKGGVCLSWMRLPPRIPGQCCILEDFTVTSRMLSQLHIFVFHRPL